MNDKMTLIQYSIEKYEKDVMLEKISWLKEHPENVRPEGFRAF